MKKYEFKEWTQFCDFANGNTSRYPTYWRGQRDPNWPLASTFERIMLGFPKDVRNHIVQRGLYKKTRDDYLEVFKINATGLRGSNPKDLVPDQWWALGRHYGLVTPLLDWTEKPFIAAFFALVDMLDYFRKTTLMISDENVVAIYKLEHSEELEGDGFRVLTPTLDELGRIQGQRSVFTWLDSEKYFDLQGFVDSTGRGDLLTQILLSGMVISEALRDLDNHGIDYRLLFPDLTGAALATNSLGDAVIQSLLSVGAESIRDRRDNPQGPQ